MGKHTVIQNVSHPPVRLMKGFFLKACKTLMLKCVGNNHSCQQRERAGLVWISMRRKSHVQKIPVQLCGEGLEILEGTADGNSLFEQADEDDFRMHVKTANQAMFHDLLAFFRDRSERSGVCRPTVKRVAPTVRGADVRTNPAGKRRLVALFMASNRKESNLSHRVVQ